MTQLQVRGLAKAFPGQPVLQGVDLDVDAGSTVAILGPSGCGKTTLLRLITGFERPDQGTIQLTDQVVSGPGVYVPPERRRIGYVPQEGALFPHLTVADNVAFGLSRDMRRTSRVQEMLDMVGMGRLGNRMPHEISGGQQQRVAVARALAPGPSLVLLDEPFSGLDAGLRVSLRGDVKRVLTVLGATSVLVTHDQTEAFSLADEVAVMRGGKLVQRSDPSTLYWEPADLAVAQFVGEANLLAAVVHGGCATCVLGDLCLRNPGRVPNGPATVLVRPEQIVYGGADGVSAQVSTVSFLGHAAMITLVLADGVAPTTVTSLAPGYSAPRAGSQVRVRVEGSVTAYDPEASTADE